MRAFYLVASVGPSSSVEGEAQVNVSGITWDGINVPSIFSINVAVIISDNEVDLRKRVVDTIATTFGLSKNDVVNVL